MSDAHEPAVATSQAWSIAEKRFLAAMWFRNISIPLLVKTLGRGDDSVKSQARKMQLPRREMLVKDWATAEPLIKEAQQDVNDNRQIKKGRYTIRKCLIHQEPFASEGAHNQICPQCKETDLWQSI